MEPNNYEELYNEIVKEIIKREYCYYKLWTEEREMGLDFKTTLARWRQNYDLAKKFGFVDKLIRDEC